MTKVYPNTNAWDLELEEEEEEPKPVSEGHVVSVLTVWKKSLLFNCNGFTVFDATGNLAFRVDNYAAGNKGEIVLMDAGGKPLLTIRRKRLSLLGGKWMVFDGETAVKPRFDVKKHRRSLLKSKSSKLLGEVSSGGSNSNSNSNSNSKKVIYGMEGSYAQRCCAVYDEKRRCVAEIKRKEAAVGGVDFGVDVFRLIVQPQMDPVVAMALVISMDHMFKST
ncbi:hypothetical protein HHK36_033370 [Tetracentron sinense]|uniref:Protein LURP-one-related 8 n=1 Tax=Tetracentron sinense TaxID=13715 RepID=A0A834Y5B4_TETSI|nr:hypothetical protein HHK36_033370 [Tetracentron sinense]